MLPVLRQGINAINLMGLTKRLFDEYLDANYECERCAGHGGTYMDDGYLACFNCGDSGWQQHKPKHMVEGPFCRGIVTTPNYRQGWYY